MRLVVADAGPVHYLVLTGDIALLPRLFEQCLTPERVRDELVHSKAPEAVRAWIVAPPPGSKFVRSKTNQMQAT